MPRMSEYPLDNSPSAEDTVNYVDVSAGTTDKATWTGVAQSAAFANEYTSIAGISSRIDARNVFLAAPSASGDDTATIQASLNANIRTTLGPGIWRADGLVIPPGHTLTGIANNTGMTYDTSNLTVIRARDGATSEYVVEFDDTPRPGASDSAGSALTHVGIHGNLVCKGVHVLGLKQLVSDVAIHMTSAEGFVMLAGASFIDKVTVTDTFNAGAPTSPTGSAVLGGADNVIRECEFSGLPDHAGGAFFGGNWAACYVTTANSFFDAVVGEYADHGFHIAASGLFNRWSNCRADKNWGHGFFLNFTSYQMFSTCTAHDNSRGAPGTYDQFHSLSSVHCSFVACNVFAVWPDKARFGFYDNVSAGEFENKYSAISAPNGWDTAPTGGGASFYDPNSDASTIASITNDIKGVSVAINNIENQLGSVVSRTQTIAAVAGMNVIDLNEGIDVHIGSTSGAFSVSFTNVPTGAAVIHMSINVSNNDDAPSFPDVKWYGTAPLTSDWDANETNVIRLTKLPFVDQLIAEWVYNGVTPNPEPVVTPPTLTAAYSTSSTRSPATNLAAATLPAGEVAVFFSASDVSVVSSWRIFCNHTGGLPAVGAEADSFVRSTSTAPYDLLGAVGSLAVMWDTNDDPTGNNRTGYNPNGSTTFTVEATLIDGATVEQTFTFTTSNAPAGSAPTHVHYTVPFGNADTPTTVTVPDAVDRIVIVTAHYSVGGSAYAMTGMTLGGVAMTVLTAATQVPGDSQGLGSMTAYLPESSIPTGNQNLVLQPSFLASPASGSAIVYEIDVRTNVAGALPVAMKDYDNVSPTTGATQTPTVSALANSMISTSSASQQITTASTVDIGTMANPVEVTSYPSLQSRYAYLADSGAAASEVATWSTTGRSVSVIVAMSYTASTGGGGTTTITPGTPVVGTITVGDNRLTVPWAATADAVSYEIRWGTSNPPAGAPVVATSPHLITGLAASTLYYVQVRAKSSTNTYSAWSTAASATPTGAVTPPPVFSGKFLVSFDHRDVMMGEGSGQPSFPDWWTQRGFWRINPANTEYALGDQANNGFLDQAINRFENRTSAARPFRDACGPRLIATSKLAIVGARQNSTASAAEKAAGIADMGKSGSKGTINRDATWRRLGQQINRTYRGYDVRKIFFLSMSHENNGPWAYSYAGRNTQLIGQPALTGATNAQYGPAMGEALRYAGATGDCSIVHKLACEHKWDIIQSECGNQAIIGMTPSDGASSDITGTAASNLGATWVRASFPDRPIDFLCPTMYFRGQNNVRYIGSGDVNDYRNYTRDRGWLEYTKEYANDIYGCAFGLLEFGGDFAVPGQLDVGAGDSQTDNAMAAGFQKVLEDVLTEANYPNGLAFVNHWDFMRWEGSNSDPGCSFFPLEGIWGLFPAGTTPMIGSGMSTALSKPTWSTQASNTRYPKTLNYLRSQFTT